MDGGAEGLPMHPPFRLEVSYSSVLGLFGQVLGLSHLIVGLIG